MYWEHYLFMGRGENALKKAYLQKALTFINSETRLLNLKIQYPEQFNPPAPQTFKSNLHIIPKSKGLGIIGFVELTVSLFLLGEIYTKTGKHASLSDIARAFELMFNFNFGSIYKKRIALFDRKTCNLTRLLDSLKNLLLKENRNKMKNNDS